MKKIIPYGRQFIDADDIEAVVEALKSDFLTTGPKVKKFEDSIVEYIGCKYAVAVMNCTAALHLACLALEMDSEYEGITSPNTFLATSNAIIYTGGKPVFADIEKESYNISPTEIEKNITEKTKVIAPVHFAGRPCDLDAINKIANKYNLFIVEDAAHAIGSVYKNTKIGDCAFSDMTCFSFHPVKHITTGEGGLITTNNKNLYKKLLSLRSHGIVKNPEKMTRHEGMWYYEMQSLGYNYRITDFQCALGISQLKKLDGFIDRRNEIINKYNISFKNIDTLTIPAVKEDAIPAYHLYVLLFNFTKIGKNRQQIMNELKNKGILTQVHYIPIYRQPYYERIYGCQNKNFPNMEWYYNHTISLPLYPQMTNDDVDFVIDSVLESLQ